MNWIITYEDITYVLCGHWIDTPKYLQGDISEEVSAKSNILKNKNV